MSIYHKQLNVNYDSSLGQPLKHFDFKDTYYKTIQLHLINNLLQN